VLIAMAVQDNLSTGDTRMKLDAQKVFTILMAAVVMPLAGWVWSVNVEVSQLRNDVGDLERQVAELEEQVDEQEEATRTLIRVESELTHLRDILDRIEDLVTQ
tara:strand:+ start:556 stop:864 length:309 start_codon:yes stop_codon:yes gene_type:complete